MIDVRRSTKEVYVQNQSQGTLHLLRSVAARYIGTVSGCLTFDPTTHVGESKICGRFFGWCLKANQRKPPILSSALCLKHDNFGRQIEMRAVRFHSSQAIGGKEASCRAGAER